jgi:mRNA-degrading endonuclease YafQ of YafQ-DinJ toxin-antitoxin module
MIKVSFSSSFRRSFKKRIKGKAKLEAFTKNPFSPSLRTHKLSGKLENLWSFTIEYDQRVLFYFIDNKNAVFIDIGNHDEVY